MIVSQQLFDAIKSGAEERTLIMFPSLPGSMDRLRPVEWKGDWQEFLDLAVRVGVSLIYGKSAQFDVETTAGFIREFESNLIDSEEEQSGSEVWLRQRLEECGGPWERRRGEVAEVEVLWVKDGVAHRLHREADWVEEARRTVWTIVLEARQMSDADRRVRSVEESLRIHGLASQMAGHQRFLDASNDAKREFMAQQLFPEEGGNHKRLAQLASLVYWWELEPEHQATNEQKVLELYQKGESPTNIAGVLKISPARAKRIIQNREAGLP